VDCVAFGMRRVVPAVLLALALPLLASCSSAPQGQGTVVGMLADNGGQAEPNGGQACGGGGPAHPLLHLCLQSGTISFSGPENRTVPTTGQFRVTLPAGTYQVKSQCETITVSVIPDKTVTADLWCQIP
jgi:hypothetical protein